VVGAERTSSLAVFAVVIADTRSSVFSEWVAAAIVRTSYPEISPRVEYRLTPAGERLKVVLDTMAAWVEQDLSR
jgi:hypothetical protein